MRLLTHTLLLQLILMVVAVTTAAMATVVVDIILTHNIIMVATVANRLKQYLMKPPYRRLHLV